MSIESFAAASVNNLAKQHIVIISPATAKANNGNWQTASRWARLLGGRYRVTIANEWSGQPCAAMIALHARRSAASVAAHAQACPGQPRILVLTGTDLYRDIRTDADAQRSLRLADKLVLLQEAGLRELGDVMRAKAIVIYQSAPSRQPAAWKTKPRHIDITMIGHLRDEKDPLAFMQAAALVTSPRVRLLHIGGALDPALGERAHETQQASPRYHWLGALAHAETRRRLGRSYLMAITSKMEGGANVIIEAVTSGVPVLASDIPGNRGMLGDDYGGFFPVGDSRALAGMIDRAVADPAFYRLLRQQCAARAQRFSPLAEQAAVLQLVDNLLILRTGAARAVARA